MQASPSGEFDVVVVGSGFGGSVAAYRLAQAGLDVCVLERGKPYPPGSFARRPHEMATNVWDPSRGYHGLFDLYSFRGIDVLVSSGLGGGSLIYANVLLRKDERWFVQDDPFGSGYEHWPISRADLEPHYDAVERMLGAQTIPFGEPGYPQVPKTAAFRGAAEQAGLEWGLAPVAVTFRNPGRPPVPSEPIPDLAFPNLHGLPRRTCRLCGECDVGCNDGAKNTLDHTYLSGAQHHGAVLRTRCEVHRIAPRPGGGYVVGYVEHTPEQEGRRTRVDRLPVKSVVCDRVILGAGALGSTGLLLRNRGALSQLGPALGTRFCGNGDLLSFVMDCHETDGRRRVHRLVDGSLGPVITSYARSPDTVEGGAGPGFYVEDAGYPVFVDWLAEVGHVPGTVRRVLRAAWRRVVARFSRDPRSQLGAELADLIGRATLSSSSLPLLGMGRDVPDGVMRLRSNHLDIDWTIATSKSYFDHLRKGMARLADGLGGELQDSPLWWLKRVITVHPLGGVPMGRHVGEGVVDQWGESFAYPGIHVLDGAAMPGPIGANPSLTIAAFADRAAERILASAQPRRRATAVRAPATPAMSPRSAGDGNRAAGGPLDTSLSFTEEMKGFVSFGATDFEVGYETGKQSGTAFMFHLTMALDDVDRFLGNARHQAPAEGWIECEALGGRRTLSSGQFNLFVRDGEPGVTHMYYRLFFDDVGGNPLTMTGFKDVRDDPGFDVWGDTTTLYIRLLRGHVAEGDDQAAELVASGILKILIKDFANQLSTFRVYGGSGVIERVRALAAFGRSFVGDLWDVFGGRAIPEDDDR